MIRVVARHRSLLGVLAVAHLADSGCGYKLIDYREPHSGVQSVSIRTFRNDSYEPGVEFVVADALRREFLRRGVVALTGDENEADLVISGAVIPIRTRTSIF